MASRKEISTPDTMSFENELSILELPPKEFALEIKKLETEVKDKIKLEEVEKKASLIASVLSSILLTVLMALIIKLVSY